MISVLGVPLTFLSTLSVRRATHPAVFKQFIISISIHALREESDGAASTWFVSSTNFYPRSP